MCLTCFVGVCNSIQALLSAPNPDDPLAENVAKHWKDNEQEAVKMGVLPTNCHRDQITLQTSVSVQPALKRAACPSDYACSFPCMPASLLSETSCWVCYSKAVDTLVCHRWMRMRCINRSSDPAWLARSNNWGCRLGQCQVFSEDVIGEDSLC